MSLEAGFAEHLTKPVDLARLLAAVQLVSAEGRVADAEGAGPAVGTS